MIDPNKTLKEFARLDTLVARLRAERDAAIALALDACGAGQAPHVHERLASIRKAVLAILDGES